MAGRSLNKRGVSFSFLFPRSQEFVLFFLVYFLLSVVYFYKFTDFENIFPGADLVSFFLPYLDAWVQQVKDFQPPLWNPDHWAGTPLAARLQPGVFYPFYIFYLFLPFFLVFNYLFILHFALGGTFLYILLRTVGANIGGAFISGLSFMFGGYLLSIYTYPSTFFAVVWVSLIVLGFFKGNQTNDLRWAIFSGCVGSLMFFIGGIETCYQIFPFLIFFYLIPNIFQGIAIPLNLKKRLQFIFVFLISFLGLISVQLIPTYELISFSMRQEGLDLKNASVWAFKLRDFLKFFLIDPFGDGWDQKNLFLNQNWIGSFYLGLIPFFLIIIFLFEGGRKRIPWVIVCVFSIYISMGNDSYLYHLMYNFLPWFSGFRYPVKFILPTIILLCFAAGWGWHCYANFVKEKNKKAEKWALYFLIFSAIFMVLYGCIDFQQKYWVDWVNNKGWSFPEFNKAETNILNIKRLLMFTSLFGLASFLFYKVSRFKWIFYFAAIFIFFLDIFFYTFGYWGTLSTEKFKNPDKISKFLLENNGGFRVLILNSTEVQEKQNLVQTVRFGKIVRGSIVPLETRSVPGIKHFDARTVINIKRDKSIFKFVNMKPLTDKLEFLSMSNIKYILSREKINSPKLKNLGIERFDIAKNLDLNDSKNDFKIEPISLYENLNVYPLAFLVNDCKVILKQEEWSHAFLDNVFHPKDILYLDEAPKGFTCGQGATLNLGSVKVLDYHYGDLDLTVEVSSKKFLFVSESFYPGWEATVDGTSVKIYQANYKFRAILLEPGTHRVQFRYRPWSFRIGLIITLSTILVIAIYLWRSRKAPWNEPKLVTYNTNSFFST